MAPIRKLVTLAVAGTSSLLPFPGLAGAAAVEPGSYAWPVHGPVIRGFEEPTTPYSAGHRGMDIGAPFGSEMVAAQSGSVAFAGWIGGSLFISVDHPDGVRTTYSWLSETLVGRGDAVERGEPIGRTGHGHPESSTPHLHFGARIGTTYIDPMLLLQGGVAGLIHLAPLSGPSLQLGLAEKFLTLPSTPVGPQSHALGAALDCPGLWRRRCSFFSRPPRLGRAPGLAFAPRRTGTPRGGGGRKPQSPLEGRLAREST